MLESIDNLINNTEDSLEMRLLHKYVIFQFVWAVFNGVMSLMIGMPLQTSLVFFGLALGLVIIFIPAFITKKISISSKIYFWIAFFTIPVLWYAVGGSRSSGNILFVAELQLFTMCLRGRRQKIFIGLSIFSTFLIMAASRRAPEVFPLLLNDRQYAMENTLLGLSTSILIVVLLIVQKKEYMIEREKVILSEEKLRRSNQLQKTFLANMSHEIRSPLGIVLGFNDLIAESNDIEQIHEYTKNIRNSGKTLQTVINDILDYSKIESGKLEIITVDYSLDELLDEINYAIRFKCEEKGLSFETKLCNQLPTFLYGDNIRIKQILINVLSNAVKYTQAGFVRLEVDCLNRTPSGEYVLQFKVSDSGQGISEEEIPSLFLAFQRLNEGHNRGIEGTGLGLAITKQLLDEMNGEISVESKLGEGSTFTITLTQPSGQATGVVVSKQAQQEEVSKTPKLLMVDDTKMNLILVQKILSRENVETTLLESGKEFLEEIHKNHYDIIFLDHMMPEMDGVEAFELMKKDPGMNEGVPVVMLTANAMSGAEQEYTAMGFSGYLSKPIDREKMISTIQRLTRYN